MEVRVWWGGVASDVPQWSQNPTFISGLGHKRAPRAPDCQPSQRRTPSASLLNACLLNAACPIKHLVTQDLNCFS